MYFGLAWKRGVVDREWWRKYATFKRHAERAKLLLSMQAYGTGYPYRERP
jgi:hypothetical protein